MIYSGYKNLIGNINQNNKEITDIKKSLKFKDLYNNMDVRMKVLEKLSENRNKKAQIDPRIIGIIILLILLYLFLKSMKILP